MEGLLAKYQEELLQIRRICSEFAQRYPRLASKLDTSGEVCEDPHIERLIQATALMTTRVSKRLDEDYPKFTEGLLDLMFPHYLRQFPSCSVVQLDPAGRQGKTMTDSFTMPRGT